VSKGSSPRPHDPTKFRDNWERIFKKRAQYVAPEDAAELLDEHTRLWADEYARLYKTYPAREEEDTTREEG